MDLGTLRIRVRKAYCPELECFISCVAIGEMSDGRKVWVSLDDPFYQFILLGGSFRVLTEGYYDDL